MASKVEGEQLQGLVCPMCLDVFKNATLLSCGHTFCKGCLETYDEQHDDIDHIVCPVCRHNTKLGRNRVSGLTPNFSLKGLQENLHVDVNKRSSNFCSFHSQIYKDIFCKDCGEFICLTCYLNDHKDHKFKKKEEFEGYLRKKTETLIQNSKTKKTQIEESINNAEQQKIDIHCHFNNVEKAIKDEFDKRVKVLQKNETTLLETLDHIRKDTESQVEGCIAKYRKVIDYINRCAVELRSYTGKNLDSDTIKAQHLQCSDLEKSLREKSIDEESMDRLKQTAECSWFRPEDENLLALGHIERDVKETKSNIQRVKTAAGENKKAKQVEPSRKVAAPVSVQSKPLNIVIEFDTPNNIWGMSALSQDAVTVGYGWNKKGSDCFTVSGEKEHHLENKIGRVCDIAVLADGRSVVSHDWGRISVYSTQDTHNTGIRYRCRQGKSVIRLCVEQYDNIYAVSGNPEIYIFHGSNPNPHRVVPTGDIKPIQICVTKTAVLITSTCNTTPSTVTVFDGEDHVGGSITASDDNEYLFATVDNQDRVLVARVRGRSDVLKLTRYTLEGTTLIQQMTFNELNLHHQLYTNCCMASLAPHMLAFARYDRLYFIQLSV